MLDKLKQLKQIRDLQKEIGKESIEIQRQGIKVTIGGDMKVLDLSLNPQLSNTDNGRIAQDLINEGLDKIQRKIAGLMGNFNF
ncbi:MAG: hypothetical protein COV31_01100 [Candidatus Yanofskybacteria bacterium CG10_big_fil_rev_8_21_14_0_10_46_23]|uniref:Nucleoid-associated protein, YbaB/EbfC family n=1 Tax=Candidatus Yanofskybacteria bacterium CG10_big_fil_rev_8_21_14_0_10_46_23 TaxID=1975098 RepID=A0A2H0R5Z6_9BACT|nr:MAG: hypothetical protein COV31_01100 [Candidatus Yanofskybacteria bacterium CG10_big_fil_rev_8_21_14_0_10_46_23]